MKTLLIATVIAVLSGPAFADDMQIEVDKALALGKSFAIVDGLKVLANRGNLKASYQLGILYRDGTHVRKDPAMARDFLKVAADDDYIRLKYKDGLMEAQYALGVMERDGIGGKVDLDDAADWFDDAAQQGYAPAQLALAELYLKGGGVDRDYERAYMWASIAAEQLSGDEKRKADGILTSAQKGLAPANLDKAKKLASEWKPR